MYDLNEFAERLKFFREKKGWTQLQLAEKAGIAESSIYFYEKGKNYPSVLILQYICSTLEVSSDNLIGLGRAKYIINLPANFGIRLRYFRKLKLLSQKKLVKVSGVSLSQILGYENFRSNPNVLILKKFCDALNVTGGDLLGF